MGASPSFGPRSWRSFFSITLYDYRKQGRFLLHEFVLMPDHLHMMITPSIKIPLEGAIQFIKGGFSYRVAKELQIKSEIWQRGFENHRVRDERDYEHHRTYSHMNPVRAGLAARASDYAYSSANPSFALDKPTTAEAGSSS